MGGMKTPLNKAPKSIVFLPKGTHNITPTVNGEAGRREVTTSAEDAEALQASLEERQKKNVKPHAGYNHKSGPASFHPKRFWWHDDYGVMVDTKWTRSGKEAVEGEDFNYFSPTFLLKKGRPVGLLPSGEIGSLTNNPAFTEMPSVQDADEIAAENVATLGHAVNLGLVVEVVKAEEDMKHEDLVKLDLISAEEAKQDNALELAQAKLDSLAKDKVETVSAELKATHKEASEKLTGKVEKLEAENKQLKEDAAEKIEAEADKAVKDAVLAGKIAPKDEATQDFYKKSFIADPSGTETVLASLHADPALAEDPKTKAKKEEKPTLSGLEAVAAELSQEAQAAS